MVTASPLRGIGVLAFVGIACAALGFKQMCCFPHALTSPCGRWLSALSNSSPAGDVRHVSAAAEEGRPAVPGSFKPRTAGAGRANIFVERNDLFGLQAAPHSRQSVRQLCLEIASDGQIQSDMTDRAPNPCCLLVTAEATVARRRFGTDRQPWRHQTREQRPSQKGVQYEKRFILGVLWTSYKCRAPARVQKTLLSQITEAGSPQEMPIQSRFRYRNAIQATLIMLHHAGSCGSGRHPIYAPIQALGRWPRYYRILRFPAPTIRCFQLLKAAVLSQRLKVMRIREIQLLETAQMTK